MLNTQHKLIADSFQLFLSNHIAILEQRKQNLMFANMQPHHFEHSLHSDLSKPQKLLVHYPRIEFPPQKSSVSDDFDREGSHKPIYCYMLLHREKCKKKNISELGSLGIPISLVRTYIKRNSNCCTMHALCTLLIQSRVLFSLYFFCQSLLSYLVHLVIF